MLGETMREMKSTYLLTGGPGTGKSALIKLIGIQLIDRGYDVDYIRSPREPDAVAGLYLPKHKLCLLNEKEFAANIIQKQNNFKEIPFASICRPSRMQEHHDRIRELEYRLLKIEENIVHQLKTDYPVQSQAKNITIPLKSLLEINNTSKAFAPDNEVEEILSKIKKNCISYCFLHALQIDGWLNLAPRYVKEYDRIYLEGEDSPAILIDILQEVSCFGQVIEIIVNPLKPDTVMGIAFPEKNLAVWQGNPSNTEEQGFKKKHSDQLLEILEQHKTARIQLKNLMHDTVNFRGLDELRSELLSAVLADLIAVPQ
jgi:hypothetical protein